MQIIRKNPLQSIEIMISLFILINLLTTAKAADFITCKSIYALCTEAKCQPISGTNDLASCICKVKTGYSAGQKPCQGVKNTEQGKEIKSRYYPIRSYISCSNDRPWAWCLDKPCIINKKSRSVAICTCTIVKNTGDYIIVTDKYHESACTTGLYSSATVEDAHQMTEFLKTQKTLQPFPIKVYSAKK